MTIVCHILVAGDKRAYDHLEQATRDWACPLSMTADSGPAHVDWHPELDDIASTVLRRLEHRVVVVAEDAFGRGLHAVSDLRRRGVRLPLVMLLPQDASIDQMARALRSGATEVVRYGDSADVIRGAVERSIVRAHGLSAGHVAASEFTENGNGAAATDDVGSVLAQVAADSGDGVVVWVPESDTVWSSPSALAQAGFARVSPESRLTDWLAEVHSDDRARVKTMMRAVADGILPQLETNYRREFGPGGHRWMLLRGRLQVDGSVAMAQTDITAGSLVMGEVAALGLQDELTGLATRSVLLARTAQCVAEHRSDEKNLFAVVALDLDRFARINNSLGHVIGDELLKGVAKRLLKCVRTGDLVARTGSDDFAMLLTNINALEDAEEVVARVSKAMDQAFDLAGHQVHCSFSAGIVLVRSRYDRPEELLRDASLALRRARTGGGDRSEVFETAMHMSAVNHQLTEILLRRGIAANQLRLHFQPLFEVQHDQKLAGFEALVRWEHPTRGLLLPGTFIPIAEDSDLIVELGGWVVTNACLQAARWLPSMNGEGLVVNVNIGARHFNHPSILQDVAQALDTSGLPPQALQLEITESGLMDHVGIAIPNVRKLRAMGVGVQMDDFGTGYSSLSYLTQLSVSALKVDQAFTTTLPESKPHGQIVEAIVSLARILGLRVTAEGVETPEQLQAITALGCDVAQGNYLGGPIPADDVADWIASHA